MVERVLRNPHPCARYKIPEVEANDPLVRELHQILVRRRCHLRRVAAAAGIGGDTIRSWLVGYRNPNLFLFSAVLGVLGYELKIVRREAND